MPWPVTSCENDTEQWILSAFSCLFILSHRLDLVSRYSVFILNHCLTNMLTYISVWLKWVAFEHLITFSLC